MDKPSHKASHTRTMRERLRARAPFLVQSALDDVFRRPSVRSALADAAQARLDPKRLQLANPLVNDAFDSIRIPGVDGRGDVSIDQALGRHLDDALDAMFPDEQATAPSEHLKRRFHLAGRKTFRRRANRRREALATDVRRLQLHLLEEACAEYWRGHLDQLTRAMVRTTRSLERLTRKAGDPDTAWRSDDDQEYLGYFHGYEPTESDVAIAAQTASHTVSMTVSKPVPMAQRGDAPRGWRRWFDVYSNFDRDLADPGAYPVLDRTVTLSQNLADQVRSVADEIAGMPEAFHEAVGARAVAHFQHAVDAFQPVFDAALAKGDAVRRATSRRTSDQLLTALYDGLTAMQTAAQAGSVEEAYEAASARTGAIGADRMRPLFRVFHDATAQVQASLETLHTAELDTDARRGHTDRIDAETTRLSQDVRQQELAYDALVRIETWHAQLASNPSSVAVDAFAPYVDGLRALDRSDVDLSVTALNIERLINVRVKDATRIAARFAAGDTPNATARAELLDNRAYLTRVADVLRQVERLDQAVGSPGLDAFVAFIDRSLDCADDAV